MKLFLIAYVVCTALLSAILFQDKELEKSMERGRDIYNDFCVNCHLTQGEGVAHTFPPLAKSDYLMQQRENSIRGIKYGQSGEIKVNNITYNGAMPAMGLSDEEVADVMNYISNSWGNVSKKIVTPKEVALMAKE